MRGRAELRADMEGSTVEDHKQKLLWNVKREVRAADVRARPLVR